MGKVNKDQPGGITDIVDITFEDLQRTGFLDGNNQVAVAVVNPGECLDMALVQVTEAFAGVTILMDVGYLVTDPDDFVDALDITAAGASTIVKTSSNFTGTLSNGEAMTEGNSGATTIRAEFTGTVANLTAGKLRIGFRISSIV